MSYVQDFNTYIGKQAGREVSKHGLGYDVVLTLMQTYLEQGYHLFIDNFYSSVTLAKGLFNRGTLVTGTILDSRRDFPASLKKCKEWGKVSPREPCVGIAMGSQQSSLHDYHLYQCK